MSKTKMKRTNLYLTQNQHLEISEEAEKRGINFSEMFRKIIDNYLEKPIFRKSILIDAMININADDESGACLSINADNKVWAVRVGATEYEKLFDCVDTYKALEQAFEWIKENE